MKFPLAFLLTTLLSSTQAVQAESTKSARSHTSLQDASPALAAYNDDLLMGDVWQREGLKKRDRSLVTLAALVARNHTGELESYVNRALDNGVTPEEISELLTHLAFYAGWGNAVSAAAITSAVFHQRGVKGKQLAKVAPPLLPLDDKAEKGRETYVENLYGDTAPGVLKYTTDVLFRDLWLRPSLAPRDRSLVTVSALIATGKTEQVAFHLNRAMDNGLSRAEASEMLTHLAFYAGWPNIFSTLPVAKEVFENRAVK